MTKKEIINNLKNNEKFHDGSLLIQGRTFIGGAYWAFQNQNELQKNFFEKWPNMVYIINEDTITIYSNNQAPRTSNNTTQAIFRHQPYVKLTFNESEELIKKKYKIHKKNFFIIIFIIGIFLSFGLYIIPLTINPTLPVELLAIFPSVIFIWLCTLSFFIFFSTVFDYIILRINVKKILNSI